MTNWWMRYYSISVQAPYIFHWSCHCINVVVFFLCFIDVVDAVRVVVLVFYVAGVVKFCIFLM